MNKRLLVYFNEFSAIPIEVRNSFYNSKLKNLNSINNKNLVLYKIIENFLIGREKGIEWDNFKISKKLNVSESMLNCHRSRLLKQLREFYFNCKPAADISILEKGFEYMKNSMIREAKNSFDRCKNKISDPDTLSRIYEFYSIYYHRHRDKIRFSKNLSEFKNLYNRSRRKKIKNSDRTKILIRYKYAESLGHQFILRTEKSYEISLKILYDCLKLSEKIKYIPEILKFRFLIGNLEIENSSFDKARNHFSKGLALATKNKFFTESKLFKTKLNHLDFLNDNSLASKLTSETLKIYDNLPVTVYSDYRLHILFHLLRFSSFATDKHLFNSLSLKLVNELFLYSRFADAFFRYYTLKTDEYIDKLHVWYYDNNKLNVELNSEILNAFVSFNYRSIFSLRKLYGNDQLFFVYITQIEIEFWKWENAVFENANFFIKKIERILRNNHSISNTEYFHTLKFCINILQDSKIMSDKTLIKKYYPVFISLIENLKNKDRKYNIIYDFTLLKFLSQKLNIKIFSDKTEKLFLWIKNKKPELIKRLLIPVYSQTA